MSLEIVWQGGSVNDAPRERTGFLSSAEARLNDGEFVVPKPDDDVASTQTAAQTIGNGARKRIADRGTQGVVCLPETIEVETQNACLGVTVGSDAATEFAWKVCLAAAAPWFARAFARMWMIALFIERPSAIARERMRSLVPSETRG